MSSAQESRREVTKQHLPGDPPRELTLIEISYPVGTGSPPHVHPNGVMAFVAAGEITSRVGDEPEHTYGVGESWWERPGAIHHVSRNAGAEEPATLLAIYITPAGAAPEDLMQPI